MKPALMLVCSLWLTVALCVAVAVMGREYLGLPGLLLVTGVAVFMMSLAVKFTRYRRQRIPHSLAKDRKENDLRRKRSRRGRL